MSSVCERAGAGEGEFLGAGRVVGSLVLVPPVVSVFSQTTPTPSGLPRASMRARSLGCSPPFVGRPGVAMAFPLALAGGFLLRRVWAVAMAAAEHHPSLGMGMSVLLPIFSLSPSLLLCLLGPLVPGPLPT